MKMLLYIKPFGNFQFDFPPPESFQELNDEFLKLFFVLDSSITNNIVDVGFCQLPYDFYRQEVLSFHELLKSNGLYIFITEYWTSLIACQRH